MHFYIQMPKTVFFPSRERGSFFLPRLLGRALKPFYGLPPDCAFSWKRYSVVKIQFCKMRPASHYAFCICGMIITEIIAKEQAIPWRVCFILSRHLFGAFAKICKDVDITHQKNAAIHPFRRFLRATIWRINWKNFFVVHHELWRNHLMTSVRFPRITVRSYPNPRQM